MIANEYTTQFQCFLASQGLAVDSIAVPSGYEYIIWITREIREFIQDRKIREDFFLSYQKDFIENLTNKYLGGSYVGK